jgi:hypothetical protein
MGGELRRIDPSRESGLHELGNPGNEPNSFTFQLKYARKQTEDILLNLESLVKNTIDKAPVRVGKFCLDRSTNCPDLTHEEVKWERAMYRKWGPEGPDDYVPFCKRIQSYQYPLSAHSVVSEPSPNNTCWGKIDLLGIGADFLPVPNELKKRKTRDSPLRMLVEVAAYGFAIQKVWPHLKEQWGQDLAWCEAPPTRFAATLDRVTLIGVAPEEYWMRCLGLVPGTKEGQFPPEAWPPFWELVDALSKWFDIHFVAVEGSWDDRDGGRPTITGARVLDLRDRSASKA